MNQQSEHLMELANEIVRLRTENEKLKKQLDFSVGYDVVKSLKQQLWSALEDARLAKTQIHFLNKQVEMKSDIIDSIKTLIS